MATDLVLEKNASLVVELRFPGEEKALPLKAIVARRTETIKGRRCDFPAGLGLVFMTENVMERAFIQKVVLKALKGSLEKRQELVETLARNRIPAQQPKLLSKELAVGARQKTDTDCSIGKHEGQVCREAIRQKRGCGHDVAVKENPRERCCAEACDVDG